MAIFEIFNVLNVTYLTFKKTGMTSYLKLQIKISSGPLFLGGLCEQKSVNLNLKSVKLCA